MAAAFAGNRSARPVGGPIAAGSRISLGIYLLIVPTVLMMGLRYEIGADWFTYLANYENAPWIPFSQALRGFDPGYSAIVYAAAWLETGIWSVNLVCGAIMTLGIARFCSRQPNPALGLVVAIPYLLIVVGMGYTRQGVAIGLILAALTDVDEKSALRLTVYIFCAALFHKTSALVLPIVFAPFLRRNLLYAIGGMLAFVILFALLLAGSTDQLITNYIDAEYESSGAIIRVAMNFVPAVIALVFRKRLGFNRYMSDVWSVFAIVTLATLLLVLTANFTTAIDRLALFLIPLQIAILPRLPYVLSDRRNVKAQLLMAVCAYSAAVLLIWLGFATHATYWVPYQAYLFSDV